MTSFKLDVFELDPATMELKQTGSREFVRGDWDAINKWRRTKRQSQRASVPTATSGLAVKPYQGMGVPSGTLAWSMGSGYDVYNSAQTVCLMSVPRSARAGTRVPVCPDNFLNAIAYFAARKLSPVHWLYQHDEYHVPDETAPGYRRWRDSAVVYAVFHTSNQCTSLRDLDGPVSRLHNHTFWLTYDEAGELFDHEDTVEVYEDWVNYPSQSLLGDEELKDPYLATLLPQLDLSPAAKRCLALATDLLEHSRKLRSSYYDQYHLRSWDAGWYQLKDFWKECYPRHFQELKEQWYALRDELTPGVFDFGWLKR